jgi:hypothetical protein
VHDKYVSHGSFQVADFPEPAFTLRMRIEMFPSEMKEAAVMVTSKTKACLCMDMSLRSCGLTESKSPDADVEHVASPKWIEETPFRGRLRESVALKFLANRTAVRSAARASSRSPNNRVTPTMADEFGETSSPMQEGTLSIV